MCVRLLLDEVLLLLQLARAAFDRLKKPIMLFQQPREDVILNETSVYHYGVLVLNLGVDYVVDELSVESRNQAHRSLIGFAFGHVDNVIVQV